MKPAEHAQLLRELAYALDPPETIGTVARPINPLAARARAAAAEIEERRSAPGAADFVKAGYISGYEAGHNDTVEGCYASPEDRAAELKDQIKDEVIASARVTAAEIEGRQELEPELPKPELVEAIAQVIYGAMRFDRIDTTADWQERGNSFAQDEARRCARAVLARFGGGEGTR